MTSYLVKVRTGKNTEHFVVEVSEHEGSRGALRVLADKIFKRRAGARYRVLKVTKIDDTE